MSNIKVELNDEGVRELLKSPEMDAIIQAKAAAITAGLKGYDSDLHHYKKRNAVNIFPATKEAAKDNWENHTLTRLL